jgi:alcohol dehydrogenase (cytochrome c)
VGNQFLVPYLETSSTFFVEDIEEPHETGGRYMGGAAKLRTPFRTGVKALEPTTGAVKWNFEAPPREHTVQVGGVLSTTTGVVFHGNYETFYGLRGTDGSVLWNVHLGGRINAAPMSYAINERQFVVLAAGSTLYAFALPTADH